MKLIIKNDKEEEIYEREMAASEIGKYLMCKDCESFFQHYGLYTGNRHKDAEIAVYETGHKIAFFYKINAGHCCANGGIKNIKPDARICSKFKLINS